MSYFGICEYTLRYIPRSTVVSIRLCDLLGTSGFDPPTGALCMVRGFLLRLGLLLNRRLFPTRIFIRLVPAC